MTPRFTGKQIRDCCSVNTKSSGYLSLERPVRSHATGFGYLFFVESRLVVL